MGKIQNWLDVRHYYYCKKAIKKLKEKNYKDMTDKEKIKLGNLYGDMCLYEIHQYRTKGKKFSNL